VPEPAGDPHGRNSSSVERLSGRGQLASRVEVVVRYDDEQSTAARSALTVPTDDEAAIHQVAADLLRRTGFAQDGRGVHRVGVVLTLHRGRQPYQDQPSLW